MAVEIHQKLAQAVIDGKPKEAKALAKEALVQGLDAYTCIVEGLIKGIQRVGKLHTTGEYLLPDLLNSSEAMEAALNVLEPALIGDQKREVIALVVLGPMDGVSYENGKTLVGTMLTNNDLADDEGIPFLHWIS